MTAFEPGEGWREVQYGHELEGHEHIQWDSTGLAGGVSRLWVREDPVPPLPTAPWTLIQVTFRGGDVDRWFLDRRRNWRRTVDGDIANRTDLVGFEVLAEPRPKIDDIDIAVIRRDTYETVRNWVRDEFGSQILAEAISIRFGVES